MKPITAYKVEASGKLFESETDAHREEFMALMAKVAERLPSYEDVASGVGGVSSSRICRWLGSQIADTAYPLVFRELKEALITGAGLMVRVWERKK
jgi:hypothetical protein